MPYWPTIHRILDNAAIVLLRKLATAVVYSNTWIAIGAALLTDQTFLVLKLDADLRLVAFVFLSTLATYNFQRILRFEKWWLRAKSTRLDWLIHSRKFLVSLTIVALTGAVICGWFSLNFHQLLLLIPLGAVSVLYAWRIFPSKTGSVALRDIPGTKVFWIAASWAVVTVCLPLLSADFPEAEVWVPIVAERFFFILAITIPFDVRDLPYDSPNQKTLPQLVGVRRANIIALGMTLLFVLAAFYSLNSGSYSTPILIALVCSAVVTFIVLLFSFKHRSEHFYSALLDGLTILQPLLIWSFIR